LQCALGVAVSTVVPERASQALDGRARTREVLGDALIVAVMGRTPRRSSGSRCVVPDAAEDPGVCF
jgi:hypothetical protein